MVDSTSPESLILISQELRETEKQKIAWNMFLNQLKKYFTITYIPQDQQHHAFKSPDICIINARKIKNVIE